MGNQMLVIKNLKRIGLVLLACSLSNLPEYAFANYSDRPEVQAYIEELIAEHGFSRAALTEVFSQTQRQQKIIDLMKRPAEKRLQWHDYRKILIDDARVRQGAVFWANHESTLQRAYSEYGVPPEIIVAIIGVETRYGRITGSHAVMDALSTLAFDYPPRAVFFRKELTQFLLLAREEAKNPLSLNGSYAGAMGFGQFMPSSYRNYAVDFDGDGSRDIWLNEKDAIGSVANYFKQHGWQGTGLIAKQVQLSSDATVAMEMANDSLKPTHSVAQFASMGVATEDLAKGDTAALFEMKQANGSDYWLGFNDFYVITRYNHSRLYAMAVLQLSEAIAEAYAKRN